MKILITGGAGFIGAHIARALIDKGHSVFIVDDFNDYYDPKLKKDRIKNLLEGKNYKLYKINISNFKKLEKIFKENSIDIICHQAAQAGVRYSLENPFIYEEANIKGTLNILECARIFKIKKIVFASSSSVYGDNSNTPFSESDITDSPISLYAATKKSTELLSYSYHHLFNIPMVGLRYFTVYGPWGRPDMALFKFTKNILKEESIDVYGQGKMSRDFTFIDDIVRGVLVVLEKDFSWEIFNLGYGKPTELEKFISLIEKNTNKTAKKNYLPIQQGDVKITFADISKAKKLLDWEPQIDIETGIEKFVTWYRNYYKV